MRHRRASLTLASALAAAAVFSSHAAGQVLFSDNYDAGTSGANYDVFTANPASDGSANFAENYGLLTYEYSDGLGGFEILPVPSAPHSTGGTTVGAMRINDSSNQVNTLSAYPKLQNFSGNYKLTYDMWINYNGPETGGPRSTEWMIAGINQGAVGNRVAGPIITGTIGGQNTGNTMAVNGEHGFSLTTPGQDYRTYVNQSNQAARGFAAQGATAVDRQSGFNQYYKDLFPKPDFETLGAPGKHWVTVEISQLAGNITWKINNQLGATPTFTNIASYLDITNTSGNITLGYADFTATSAQPAGLPYQYIIYDNVEVSAVDLDLYWDIDGAGTAGGGGNTPAGNWDSLALNFNSDSTGGAGGVVTPFTSNNEDVHFAAGADGGGTYTVTVIGAQTAKSVNIDRGNVTLDGGPITTGTIYVADALCTTTGTVTGLGGSLAKTGVGTLEVIRLPQNAAMNITEGIVRVRHSTPAGPGTNPERGDDNQVSRPSALNIAAGATLDLTNNDLIVTYTGGPNPAAALEDLVAQGFNAGDWLGTGITSSTAAGDSNFHLAIADNAALAQPYGTSNGGVNFAGVDVPLESVLIKFTHRVDLDLDGLVTPNDAAIFAGNYSENDPATWATGDVDYDGIYTPNDAAIFSGFYDESLTSLPEPAGLGVLAIGCVGLLGRRRTRRGA